MTQAEHFTAELFALEPLTHRLPPGADREAIDALLDDEFVEVGASGLVYSRDFVISLVEQRYADGVDPDDTAWEIEDVSLRVLANNLCLVTYQLCFAGRYSRRSTLWRRHGLNWRALYHQGTLCEPVV